MEDQKEMEEQNKKEEKMSIIPAKMIEGKSKKFSVKPMKEIKGNIRFWNLVALILEKKMLLYKPREKK